MKPASTRMKNAITLCLGTTLGKAAFAGILLGLFLGRGGAPVRGDTSSTLGRMPRQANMLVVIDVQKILSSPVARREGWKEKSADSFAGGVLIVPPGTKSMAMAALMNLNALDTLWELSIMETDRMPAMESIARGERGCVDMLGDMKAAWSPTNAYFIALDTNILGTIWPANRQFAMRWIRQSTRSDGRRAEPWWSSQTGQDDSACLIAVDLREAASPLRALRRFQTGEFTCLTTRDVDLKTLAELLASAQGLTLRLQAGDKLTGEGEITFTQDTAILKDIGKPLLLEFLKKSGAALSDFEAWKFDVQPYKLVFKGDLSSDGFKRILSLIQPPMPNAGEPAPTPAAKAPGQEPSAAAKPQDPKAIASKRYYNSLCELLDSVGKDIGVGGLAKSIDVATVWLARDARKIEQLPVTNVDDDLLAWSNDITRKLSEMAQVFALAASATETRKADLAVQRGQGGNVNYSYNYNGTYRSGSGSGTVTYQMPSLDDQKRHATLQEREKAHVAAVQIWRDMTGKRPAMRQAMSKKYGIEF